MTEELEPVASFPPDKLTIAASYDAAGHCWEMSVRWNQEPPVETAIILRVIDELFGKVRPAPPVPLRPAGQSMPNQGTFRINNNTRTSETIGRIPGESATEIIPVWRDGNGKQR